MRYKTNQNTVENPVCTDVFHECSDRLHWFLKKNANFMYKNHSYKCFCNIYFLIYADLLLITI